ncbi:MAG: RHS repeat domain-containing protein [Gemmatimonadaceae bacterium]
MTTTAAHPCPEALLMFQRPSFTRILLSALLAAVLPIAAGTAQTSGCQTYITITQYPASPYSQVVANIVVRYGEVQATPPCLSYDAIDPSTFQFTVNGVNRTSYFSANPDSAVGTNVPLAFGNNTLTATTQGWDTDGNPRTDTDSKTVSVTVNYSGNIGFNNHDNQNSGLCEAGCFAPVHAQATVPYFSLNTPRSVTLVYHGDRVLPQPFVFADVYLAHGSVVPQQFWLKATVSGVTRTFTNGDTLLRFVGASAPRRLAGQLKLTDLTTGMYSAQIIVTASYPESVSTRSFSTKLMVVNESKSPIARGWTVSGVQRLYLQSDSSALVTDGAGSAAYFAKVSSTACNSAYTSPQGDFSCLKLSGSGFVRAYPDSTKMVFNSAGQMTSIAAPSDTIAIEYDGSGRVTKVFDPFRTYSGGANKSYIALSYGTYGITEIREPGADGSPTGGRLTQITVAADSTLTVFTDPDGISTRFSYDLVGSRRRLERIVNRRGDTTRFVYALDSSWKLTRIELPKVAIDNGGGTTRDTVLRATFRAWQTAGVPVTSTTSTPATAIGPDTTQGVVTAPDGQSTSFTVNRWGQPLKVTDALSKITTFYRSSVSGVLPDSIRNHEGGLFRYLYSGSLPTKVTWPDYSTVALRYGAFGRPDSVWGKRAGAPKRLFVGVRGRLDSLRVAGSSSNVVKFHYDGRDRDTLVIDPSGHRTTKHYDATFGNLDSTLAPGNRFTVVRFDQFGRDSAVKANGLPWRRVVYDSVNRAREGYDGVNATPTRFTFDALFLTRVADAKSQVFRQATNALGWVTQEFDPADTLNRFNAYRYSAAGRLASFTNRRGQRIDFTFDSLGRLRSKTGPTNVVTDSFAYDAGGRKSVAWNAVSRDSIFSATDGWVDSVVTRIAGRRFRMFYHHDSAGRLDSMSNTDIAGGVTFPTRRFVYNAQKGTLDSLVLNVTNKTSMAYTNDLLRKLTTFQGGFNQYDTLTQVHQRYKRSHANSAVNLAFFEGAGFDSLMRIAQTLRYNGSQSNIENKQFAYDSLGRLSAARSQTLGALCSADSTSGYSCSAATGGDTFSYDAVGNVTGGVMGGQTITTGYKVGNRDTLFRGVAHTFDLDGNVASSGSVQYHWSADGILDSVIAGTVRLRYEYDALGRLVKRSRNGSVERIFLWSGDQLIAELNGTGTQRIGEYAYFPGIDRPYAFLKGTTTVSSISFFAQDVAGNVLGIHSGSTVQQHYTYDALGAQTTLVNTLPENRLGWKGLVWEPDSTRLYFMRARWYDPVQGRFMSEDPIGLAGGINMYAFAGADPINGWDPFGLDCTVPKPWCLATVIVIGFPEAAPGGGGGPGFGGPGGGGGFGGPPRLGTEDWEGIASGGISFGSTSSPNRRSPGSQNKPIDRVACASALADLALTAIGDASVFAGGVGALRYGVMALRQANLAGMFARGATQGAAHSGLSRLNAVMMGGSGSQMFGQLAARAHDPMSGSPGWSNFVPGFATWEAGKGASAACRS